MSQFISIPTLPETSPQRSSGSIAGEFTFITVTALDPSTGTRASSTVTIEDEVALLWERADAVLAEAGLSRRDLVKSTCWVSDDEFRFPFVYAYRDQCADGVYPQRVTMVAGLPADCRCAIEFVAVAAA